MNLEAILGEGIKLSVISNDPETKSITYLSEKPNGEKGVALFSRKAYDTTTHEPKKEVMTKFFENNIYHKYSTNTDIVEIVWPANQEVVTKYSSKELVLIEESPLMYQEITLPFFKQKINDGNVKWIENIILHGKEPGNVIINKEKYIFMKDYKTNIDKAPFFECLAIFKDFKYHTLREIDQEALTTIKIMKEECITALTNRYSIGKEEIRAYVHYHPSFYVFHVHFFHSNNLSHSQAVGRAILLDDVIRNLSMCIGYYANATMTIQANKLSSIYKKIKEFKG